MNVASFTGILYTASPLFITMVDSASLPPARRAMSSTSPQPYKRAVLFVAGSRGAVLPEARNARWLCATL